MKQLSDGIALYGGIETSLPQQSTGGIWSDGIALYEGIETT